MEWDDRFLCDIFFSANLSEWCTGDFSGDLTGVRILDFVGVKLIRFEKSGSILTVCAFLRFVAANVG